MKIKATVSSIGGITSPVSLDLVSGEAIGICGRSGSGKTSFAATLAAMLAREGDRLGLGVQGKTLYQNDKADNEEPGYADMEAPDWTLGWLPGQPVSETGNAPKMPNEVANVRECLWAKGQAAATIWQRVLGCNVSMERLSKELQRIIGGEGERSEEILRNILEMVSSGDDSGDNWKSAENFCKEMRKTHRREWEKIVSEDGAERQNYGVKIAEGWRPRMWTKLAETSNSGELKQKLTELKTKKGEADRRRVVKGEEIKRRDEAVAALPNLKAEAERLEQQKSVVDKYERIMELRDDLKKLTESNSSLMDVPELKCTAEEADEKQNELDVLLHKKVAHREHQDKLALYDDAVSRLNDQEDRMCEHAENLKRAEAEAERERQKLKGALSCPECGASLKMKEKKLVAIETSGRHALDTLKEKQTKTQAVIDEIKKTMPEKPKRPAGNIQTILSKIRAAETLLGEYRASIEHRKKAEAHNEHVVAQHERQIKDIRAKLEGMGVSESGPVPEELRPNYGRDEILKELGACNEKIKAKRELVNRVGMDAVADDGEGDDAVAIDEQIEDVEKAIQARIAYTGAKEKHDLSIMWDAIASLLSPAGLRATISKDAREEINKKLEILSGATGRPGVRITEDWRVFIHHRDARIASSGERWTAGAFITIAIALRNECPIVILDKMNEMDKFDEMVHLLKDIAEKKNMAILWTAMTDEPRAGALWMEKGKFCEA